MGRVLRSVAVTATLFGALSASHAQEGAPPSSAGAATSSDGLSSTQAPPAIAVDPVQPETAATSPTTPKRTPALGEIVVTARRHEESLQDVPISVNVLDEEALAERNITNGNDLAQASPGLSGANGFSRSQILFTIHGQGEIYGIQNPGVVPYYAEAAEFSPYLYDLSSVQVLKGPQGTLFGKNTTGGAVLLTPKKPEDTYGGFFVQRLGEYSRNDQEFGFGGPVPFLQDVLSFRVAGQVLRRDGYTKNLANGDDLDNEHRESFRGSLVFRPLEGLENYTIYQYDHANENGAGDVFYALIDTVDGSLTTPYWQQLRDYLPIQQARGPREVEYDAPTKDIYRQWGLINTTTFTLPQGTFLGLDRQNFSVKNIYRFSKGGNRILQLDIDGSPYRVLGFDTTTPAAYRRTDEVQLQYDDSDGVTGVVGIYYDRADAPAFTTNAQLSVPVANVPLDLFITQGTTSRSRAAYAQGSWRFLPDWTGTVGVRRTFDTRTSDQAQYLTTLEVPISGGSFKERFNATTWNFALNYQLTDDIMNYVTVRRGYKAGGINAIDDPEKVAYKPEYVTDIELGMKSQWDIGGWQMRANVDVFYDQYKNIQRSVTPPGNLVPTLVITNAARAKLGGADLDLLIVPSEIFDATVQYTYVKTHYDEYMDPSFGDLSKGRFPNTPKHQVGLTPTIHMPLPDPWGVLAAQLPFFYQTSAAIVPNNVPNGNRTNDDALPGANRSGFHRFDFRMDWRQIHGSGLSAAFYVRNFTNEEYVVGGTNNLTSTLLGFANVLYGAPRTYSFEIRYDF